MIADYHIHTYLCRHAQGEPREYVERAIELGLDELGFADHMPFLNGFRPAIVDGADFCMDLDELDDYVALVQDLASEYRSELRIRLGIEADHVEASLEATAALLNEYPFEYVIGSVHYVGDAVPFDHPDLEWVLPQYGVDRVHRESLAAVERAARSGLYTIIGHLDQAKWAGHRPDDADGVAAAARRALLAIRDSGVAIELNTGGWRKPVGEAYPAPALLAEAAALGIPLTFGSDAHRPDDVGYAFDRAAELAQQAGYASVLRLGGAPWELT